MLTWSLGNVYAPDIFFFVSEVPPIYGSTCLPIVIKQLQPIINIV